MGGLVGKLTVTRNSNERIFSSVEERDQLLPGIPDDVTLKQIVPKLEWRVFHILSLVSHSWQQAIQSHQVHDARVRSKLSDTFLVIDGPEHTTLYSLRDKYSYKLPRVPAQHLRSAQFGSWKWIAMDGRLYVIGGVYVVKDKSCGFRRAPVYKFVASKEVYVLDLAGQREWKQCASMNERRFSFGCGVIDGRIYVFGGVGGGMADGRGSGPNGNALRGSEVYDPKDNSWSAISPEICWRWGHDVAALGKELFLFNGKAYDPENVPAEAYNNDGSLKICHERALFCEVYHTVKDEWRIIRPSWEDYRRRARIFMAKGKFYAMIKMDSHFRIDTYDYDKKIWSQLLSSSFAASAGIAEINDTVEQYDMISVKDALFVAVENQDSQEEFLLRSDGFGNDKKEILWEIESESLDIDRRSMLCTVEL